MTVPNSRPSPSLPYTKTEAPSPSPLPTKSRSAPPPLGHRLIGIPAKTPFHLPPPRVCALRKYTPPRPFR